MHKNYRNDDDLIDLRESDQEPEFKIEKVQADRAFMDQNFDSTPLTQVENLSLRPNDKVKVKFDKFATLVSTHAFEEIFAKHVDDDVIISTDLLTDLANAHEEKHDRRLPMMFIFGIVLGVILTWVLFKT